MSLSNVWAWIAIFLVLSVFRITSCQTAIAQENQATDENFAIQVRQLISQLESKSFARRQTAAQKLWELGDAARAPLRGALTDASPEVAKRIGNILNTLDIEVDARLPRGTARMVLCFSDGELEVKNQIIENLRRQHQYRLIFELLSRVPDAVQRQQLFDNNVDVPNLVIELSRTGNWEAIDQVLRDPLAWDNSLALSAYHARLNNELLPRIETLQQLVADGKANDRQVKRLITYLRIERDIAGAMAYAKNISDPIVRQSLVSSMLMESGQWDHVLEQIVRPADAFKPGQDEKLPATLPQEAIVAHFAGNVDQFNRAIEQMMQLAAFASPDPQFTNSDVADVLLACGEFERALEPVDRKDTAYMFELFARLQRYDQAFAAVGLSNNLQQRLDWVEANGRNIELLIKESETARQGPILKEKADELIRLSQSVADQLGSLGLRNEAILHYRTIIDAIPVEHEDSFRNRGDVIRQLTELGAYDEVWRILREKVVDREFWYLTEELFGERFETADFWYKRLESKYANIFDRINVIAHLVNSPLKRPDGNINLEPILNEVAGPGETEPREDEPGDLNYYIAMSCFYRGQDVLFERHLRRAAAVGHSKAVKVLAERAEVEHDWKTAARLFDQLWRNDSMPHWALRAAEAYQRLGLDEEVRRRNVVSLACWLDSFRVDSMLREFEISDMNSSLQDILTMVVYGTGDEGKSLDLYRGALSIAFAESDPNWASTNLKILTYLRFATPLPNSGRVSVVSLPILNDQLEAKAKLRNLDIDEAIREIAKINRLRPGSVELVEEIVPLLDQAGFEAQANQIFVDVSDFFLNLLQQYPDSPLHNNNYAWMCATAGRRIEFAKRHAERAVSLMPENSSYLDTLAELEFLTGNTQRAIELNRRCLQINPKLHYLRQSYRFSSNKTGAR